MSMVLNLLKYFFSKFDHLWFMSRYFIYFSCFRIREFDYHNLLISWII